MDSRFNGVPISATQMAPDASSSSYRGITIRAPLTVDESDFENSVYSPRNSTTSSYYSESELESEVFEGGESEVEKDEEFAVSGPSLRGPDEESGQESVNVKETGVFRPSVRIPDGKKYKGGSVVDDSDDAGSLLSDSGDELVKDETFIAPLGDSRPLVAVDEAVVDVRVEELRIPIAQISADSDDDSQISGVSDEEGFSGIVRVPSVEVLRRIDSALKVRVLETEGDEKIVETEFADDLVNSGAVLGSLEEMDDLDVKSSIHSFVSTDLVLNKGVDVGEEDTTNSLVVDEEFDSTLESEKNGDNLHLGSEFQERDVINEGSRSEKVESENEHDVVKSSVSADSVLNKDIDIDDEEFDSTLESGKNGDHLHLGLEIQESDVRDEEKVESENELDVVSSSVSADLVLNKDLDIDDEEFDSTLESGKNGDHPHLGLEIQEIDVRDEEKVESENKHNVVSSSVSADLVLYKDLDIDDEEFDLILESVKNVDHLHLGLEIQESNVRDEDKVESEIEHEIVNTVDYAAAEEICPVHQCVDITEVPTEVHPVVPEPHTESTALCTSDSLFKDSALSSAIDADESVSECSESAHETRKEAVASDGETVNLVANSTFSSKGEILSDHSQEIDGELEEASSEMKNKIEHLVSRLGQSSADLRDLYQLILSDQKFVSQALHLDSVELALQKTDVLDFSLSILVIGKTGVGKSATINSIFGEMKVEINAFEPATLRVKEIVGTINGVKLKVLDTPGLKASSMDQSMNRKILSSIKKAMRKSPPDVILYVDRLDARTSLHDLNSITSYLGPSMWRKSMVVFTHGASVPPDGPHGCTWDAFVAQKSRAVRQIIGRPMVPVCVVENHPFVGHNAERWRSEFLLLCCSTKILSDNVVPNVAPCCPHEFDQETGAPGMRAPPRRSVMASSWDHTGNADHFPAAVTVQFTKNVSAAFNDHLRVRVSALALVPIVRAVFGTISGQSGEDCST